MIKNIFVAGQTGSGKSHYIKTEILPKLDDRFKIIIDYKNEYEGPFVHISKMLTPFDYGKLINYAKSKKHDKIIIKMDVYDSDLLIILFEYLNGSYNKILIFDEASFFFEDLKRGDIPFEVKKFFRSSTLPHNRNHNCILITQSPQDIPKILLGQFQEGYIFYLKPYQLDYLYKNAFIPQKEYDWSEKYKHYKI